ncbi:MAG: hypothetical protein AAGK05_15640 [Pseudomonadota bacterium]
MLDDLPSLMGTVSDSEMQSLFYVSGYVAYKEHIQSDTEVQSEFSDLLANTSRGKLTFPPENLFHFCVTCYTFFKNNKNSFSCTTRLCKLFKLVCEAFNLEVPFVERVSRRFCNVFFKGLTNMENDLDRVERDEQKERKRRKFE